MTFHRWITGAFLLIVMLAALFANALVFSARSFQHNFAQVSENKSGVVSFERIRAVASEVDALEAESAPRKLELADIERQIAEQNARIEAASADMQARLTQISERLAAFEKPVGAGAPAADLDGVANRLEAIDERTLSDEDRAKFQALKTRFGETGAVNDAISAADEKKDALEAKARYVQALLNADRERVVQQKAQFGDNFDAIESEIEALSTTSPFGWGATLAQIHPTFLSTVLVCMMGALGAVLFLFPAYTAGQPVTFVTIIVRMAFGMVTAFAFFIVANSAIAAFGFSGGEASAGTPSLNPFTISGLGVIAGVMADDIAKWIHQRGVYLFSNAGQGGLGALAGAATQAARPPRTPIEPGGGLVNPHGGPHDPN